MGDGAAVILRLPNGRNVMVDVGQSSRPNVGSRVIALALWYCGISQIDAIFVTYVDVDYFNGIPQLGSF